MDVEEKKPLVCDVCFTILDSETLLMEHRIVCANSQNSVSDPPKDLLKIIQDVKVESGETQEESKFVWESIQSSLKKPLTITLTPDGASKVPEKLYLRPVDTDRFVLAMPSDRNVNWQQTSKEMRVKTLSVNSPLSPVHVYSEKAEDGVMVEPMRKVIKPSLCQQQLSNGVETNVSVFEGRNNCKICCEIFETENQLSVHMMAEHFRTLKNSCALCGVSFENHGSVVDHITKEHMDKTSLSCNICQVRFITETILTHHMLSAHTGFSVTGGGIVERSCKSRKIQRDGDHECTRTGDDQSKDTYNNMQKHHMSLRNSKKRKCAASEMASSVVQPTHPPKCNQIMTFDSNLEIKTESSENEAATLYLTKEETVLSEIKHEVDEKDFSKAVSEHESDACDEKLARIQKFEQLSQQFDSLTQGMCTVPKTELSLDNNSSQINTFKTEDLQLNGFDCSNVINIVPLEPNFDDNESLENEHKVPENKTDSAHMHLPPTFSNQQLPFETQIACKARRNPEIVLSTLPRLLPKPNSQKKTFATDKGPVKISLIPEGFAQPQKTIILHPASQHEKVPEVDQGQVKAEKAEQGQIIVKQDAKKLHKIILQDESEIKRQNALIKNLMGKLNKNSADETKVQKQLYHCKMCQMTTDDEEKIARHLVQEHGPKTKPTKRKTSKSERPPDVKKRLCKRNYCHACEISFESKQEAEAHRKTHEGQKAFKCRLCDKTFSYRSTLKTHMRVHYDEKPYVCDQCGKAFHFAAGLRSHKFTHLKEKKFRCDACGKSFKVDKTRQNHKCRADRTKGRKKSKKN